MIMSDPGTPQSDDRPGARSEPVSSVLAEMTGRPKSAFEIDNGYDFPDLEDLESVPKDEW